MTYVRYKLYTESAKLCASTRNVLPPLNIVDFGIISSAIILPSNAIFECDNCYGICPDNAIVKLGPGQRFEFKYDYCKGCGMCAAECPCGAIRMIPEQT